jgi:hypothetical protein
VSWPYIQNQIQANDKMDAGVFSVNNRHASILLTQVSTYPFYVSPSINLPVIQVPQSHVSRYLYYNFPDDMNSNLFD